MASAKLREAALKSPRQLYKFLYRECERLPKDARAFYRHSIKQSFKQHVIEPDKQRVEQMMKKAMQDAEWIVKKTVVREEGGIDSSQFFKAIEIWRRNSRAVNRRIAASVEILDVQVNCDALEMFRYIDALDISLFLTDQQQDDIDVEKLLNVLRDSERATDRKVRVYASKQLPRVPRVFSPAIEFLLVEEQENRAISVCKSLFLAKQSLGPVIAFAIRRETDGSTSIGVHRRHLDVDGVPRHDPDPSIEWLRSKLFPCISRWAKSESRVTPIPLSTLNLVPAEKYAKLYCELKEKYGKELIETWPENTDPIKFVYEDIAIATYLLLLWEKERLEKNSTDLQSFVDLGCGNGLLVHILFSEGHRGLGIDLRRRKIWDLYPAETPLQVSTVIPSSATVYPETDWIIGNHSDELTPWIPVIAARSSSDCRFFLLPCCPYELNGAKYQRYSAGKSQYSEYIEYVTSICARCGFTTHLDKLRIPSTKRICLIGWERAAEETEEREDRIRRMLNEKTTLSREASETVSDARQEWTCDFKPREKVEKVRNCTQLDKSLIASIVHVVSKKLLHQGRVISLQGGNRTWNAGRCLDLRQIAESIPRETMQRLRKECGGLQTLLKNHSYIFRVAQGKVEFRIPGAEKANEKTEQTEERYCKAKKKKRSQLPRTKIKPCWFQENHPNGCPATEAACNYKH